MANANMMKACWSFPLGLLLACSTSETSSQDGSGPANAAGLDALATDISSPNATSVDGSTPRDAFFWQRRWVGSSAGIDLTVEINGFDLGGGDLAIVSGYTSAKPCAGKTDILQGSIFFGNAIRSVKSPEIHIDSGLTGESGTTNAFFFDGILSPSGTIEGLLGFKAFGDQVSEACSVRNISISLSPVQ